MRIAVVGAGAWGTTVAALAASQTSVRLWARRPALASTINRDHENADYLPGIRLPDGVIATSRPDQALPEAEAVFVAVPSHGYRSVLQMAAPFVPAQAPVISLTKGIEASTGLRMSEVTGEVLGNHDPGVVGALSGPNLSGEIMAGQPAATVIAMPDQETAAKLQDVLTSPVFRVYTNPDVVGVEVAGATKNVIAIAAGATAGLGFGMNTMSTLVTRGLAEIIRLGVALGADPLTFGGLAGVGDLMATCGSPLSRNNRVGFRLGQGETIDQIQSSTHTVAEGVRTTGPVLDLAARHGVEMPIAQAVGRILYEGETVPEAMAKLMGRAPTTETDPAAV